MIEFDQLKNVYCSLHPRSYLQFVCLEQGCKENTFCECCIMNHPHQKYVPVRILNELLGELDTKELEKTLNIHNQNKLDYLSNFKGFLQKLQQYFDDLRGQARQDEENVLKLLQTPIKIQGKSDIVSYIEKLSNTVQLNQQGKLQLKEIHLLSFGSIEDLQLMVDQIFRDQFTKSLKQNKQKQVFQTDQIGGRSSVNLDPSLIQTDYHPWIQTDYVQQQQTSRQKPKILFLNKKIESYIFQNYNTDILINGNGKKAEQKQTLSKDRYNKVVYLSPDLNTANEATVKFIFTKQGFSAYPVKFGIYVCDPQKTDLPSLYVQNDKREKFYLFQEQPQFSNTYQIQFNKVQLTLTLSVSAYNELQQIEEHPQNKFIFCFVLQPGSTIELLG